MWRTVLVKVTWPTDFQCMTGEWWGAKINCPRASCEVKKSLGSVTRVFVVIICIWCICDYKPNYPSLSKFQPTFQWLRIQFLMPSMDHFRSTISAGVFHTLPFLSWRTLYVINPQPPPIPFWGWFIPPIFGDIGDGFIIGLTTVDLFPATKHPLV